MVRESGGSPPWKGSKVGAAGREKLGWWAKGVLICAGSHWGGGLRAF